MERPNGFPVDKARLDKIMAAVREPDQPKLTTKQRIRRILIVRASLRKRRQSPLPRRAPGAKPLPPTRLEAPAHSGGKDT
jgi:hypothetical protein